MLGIKQRTLLWPGVIFISILRVSISCITKPSLSHLEGSSASPHNLVFFRTKQETGAVIVVFI